MYKFRAISGSAWKMHSLTPPKSAKVKLSLENENLRRRSELLNTERIVYLEPQPKRNTDTSVQTTEQHHGQNIVHRAIEPETAECRRATGNAVHSAIVRE